MQLISTHLEVPHASDTQPQGPYYAEPKGQPDAASKQFGFQGTHRDEKYESPGVKKYGTQAASIGKDYDSSQSPGAQKYESDAPPRTSEPWISPAAKKFGSEGAPPA